MLRRHVVLIVFVTILGMLAGGGTWFLLNAFWPMYEATTVVEVMPPVAVDPMTIAQPQLHEKILYGHRVGLASRFMSEGSLRALLRDDDVRGTQWFDHRGSIRKAIKYLRRHLSAFPHRDADHIRLAMSCGSPKEAALIVNEAMELFVSGVVTEETGDIGSQLAELNARANGVQREIDQANAELGRIRNASGLTDLDRTGGRYFQHTITLRLNELELQENDLSLTIKQIEADIGNLERLATGPVTVQVEHAVERDTVMLSLANQLAFQRAQLAARLTRFGENHRVVRQIKELIDDLEEERRKRKALIAQQTRQANVENARDGLITLEQRLAELQRLRVDALEKQKRLDEDRSQYEQVLVVRDERVKMLETIKEQIEKYNVMLASPETPKVKMGPPALEPLEMVLSRHILVWIPAGTLLGLICGFGLACLLEMANDLVRTPRDVIRFLHLPLLGVIPDTDEDRQARKVDPFHVVRRAPHSLIGESYRRAGVNIELSEAPDAASKVVLIASGDAADGKTSVAVNLATACAAKVQRVLLIDANLRQPFVQNVLPAPDATGANLGLSNYLKGQCDAEDIVRPSGIDGLDVIHAGPVPANPVELLSGNRLRDLIDKLRSHYDRIIVDSPPLLLVTDAKVLARCTDATVLVLNAAATRRGAALRAVFEMVEVGANVTGCILFGVQAMKGGYYTEQFRAYRRYLKPQLAATG